MKHADLSGLFAMKEVMDNAKLQNIKVFLVNLSPELQSHLARSDISGDDITKCSPELQDKIFAAQAVAGGSAVESLDEESLGTVAELLRESKTSSLLELAQWSAGNTRQSKRASPDLSTGDIEMHAKSSGAVYTLVHGNDHDGHTD
jgi:hypothetical protein